MIGINTSLTTPGGGNYSLISVAQHEIDEVLGLGSDVGQTGFFSQPRAEDLYRFGHNSTTRNYTTSGDNAWFSINGGTTSLVQFNNSGNGDYGDWHTSAPSACRMPLAPPAELRPSSMMAGRTDSSQRHRIQHPGRHRRAGDVNRVDDQHGNAGFHRVRLEATQAVRRHDGGVTLSPDPRYPFRWTWQHHGNSPCFTGKASFLMLLSRFRVLPARSMCGSLQLHSAIGRVPGQTRYINLVTSCANTRFLSRSDFRAFVRRFHAGHG